jgi:hypothetical protein
MVEGFYSARILKLGDRRWRIEDRGAIETVRFDDASLLAVDFARSAGVIGERHFQGSLYVALDHAVAAPVVALKADDAPWRVPDAAAPYLVQGRWRIEQVTRRDDGWRFHGDGFGPADFLWKVPAAGRYAVTARNADGKTDSVIAKAGADGLLHFTLRLAGENGADIDVAKLGSGG